MTLNLDLCAVCFVGAINVMWCILFQIDTEIFSDCNNLKKSVKSGHRNRRYCKMKVASFWEDTTYTLSSMHILSGEHLLLLINIKSF